MTDELVTVARFTFPTEAYLAKARLEEENILSFIQGEHAGGTFVTGPLIEGIELQVREADADRAGKILHDKQGKSTENMEKEVEYKKTTITTAIIGLIFNIVFPGLGTLLMGGSKIIGAMQVSILFAGIVSGFIERDIRIKILLVGTKLTGIVEMGAVLICGVWIWAFITGIKLIRQERSKTVAFKPKELESPNKTLHGLIIGCVGGIMVWGLGLLVVYLIPIELKEDIYQLLTPRKTVSGIGISRDVIISACAKPELGFSFDKGNPIHRQDNYVAHKGNNMIQLIGPADNLLKVSVLTVIGVDSEQNLNATIVPVEIANSIDNNFTEWVVNKFKEAAETPDHLYNLYRSKSFGNKEYKIVFNTKSRLFLLEITSAE